MWKIPLGRRKLCGMSGNENQPSCSVAHLMFRKTMWCPCRRRHVLYTNVREFLFGARAPVYDECEECRPDTRDKVPAQHGAVFVPTIRVQIATVLPFRFFPVSFSWAFSCSPRIFLIFGVNFLVYIFFSFFSFRFPFIALLFSPFLFLIQQSFLYLPRYFFSRFPCVPPLTD